MTVNPESWIGEVSADELMRHTREISRWVRLSGTEDERKAFDYIWGVVKSYGMRTAMFTPTCLVSLPVSGSLMIDGERIEPCITHSFSLSTPEHGIAGELVYAGQGTETELATAGAAGKIALTDGLATPNKAYAATRAGALGVVSISGELLHEMIVSPVWGSPTPDRLEYVPQVVMLSIDSASGERLKAQLQEQRLRVRIHASVDTRWRPIPVLTADLDTDDREYVLFSGHVDSWHFGAMDNASANATMIETARILAEHRSDLRRGLRLAFWSGHSHARYAGSTWYADRFWHDLHDRCVAHVNVDSTGAIGADVLSGANTMAETYSLAREVIGRQTGQDLVYKRFGRAGDQSFWGVGLPAMFMSLSEQGEANEMTADQAFLLGGTTARGGGLGWWWHTTEDTIDKIDPENLARDTRVYVEAVGRLLTDLIVPLDVRRPIDEMVAALEEIEPLWNGLPSNGADDAPGFAGLRQDLAAARDLAEALTNRLAGDLADEEAERISTAIVSACKALIPVNYTVSGPFGHDLALGAAALSGLRPQGSTVAMSDDELWGSTHRLRREINRARSGVRSAVDALSSVAGL